MLEVVFSDSACGSLKQARRFKGGPCPHGGAAVVHPKGKFPNAEEIRAARQKFEADRRRAWDRALPLGGSPGDVFGIGLVLNIGNIAAEGFPSHRRQELERLHSAVFSDGTADVQAQFRQTMERFHRLMARAAAGETIRIWYTGSPEELCGFYFLTDQLARLPRHGEILRIRLPEWEADSESSARHVFSCGELAPQDWGRYLHRAQSVTPGELSRLSAQWRGLQTENAPLRALVNGRLCSVPVDFYDSLIRQEIAAEPGEFQEAMVIGRVIGKYEPGVGDGWIALRIEEMLRAGELKAVTSNTPDSPVYRRILKKCGL